MTPERWARLIAGSAVLTGLLLGLTVSKYWLLLAAFVGGDILQSALTRWRLIEDVLARIAAKRRAKNAETQ